VRRPTRLLPVASALLLLLGPLASSAIGQTRSPSAPRAHAAASYLTGIGDEQPEMFNDPNWRQLHTKIARYIAPYDAAVRPPSLAAAKIWIHAAERQHSQVLVSFYHSEYTPLRMPSVPQYQRDVQKFVKLFPRVHQYQAWDEANRGYVAHAFSSPSAAAAADYYQALIRVCKGCTVVGLDVLDQFLIGPTLTYIAEFKHEIGRLRTVMPRVWGLHDYSDVNRYESWRTRELSRALGGEVWLTETGGIVQFGGAFPNIHGSGLTRAARVTKYMFGAAASVSQIKRLYIYDWTGGVSSTRFDAGLTDNHHKPRAGYVVVCRQLHAAKCSIRASSH
jgi:hypothetical protein